jgi:low temperature requirement protein LtrA
MAASVPVMIVSAFLTAVARLPVWAVFVAGWIALLVLVGRSRVGLSRGMAPTDSLAERFGTFTLVVLGEVVFASSTDSRSPITTSRRSRWA